MAQPAPGRGDASGPWALAYLYDERSTDAPRRYTDEIFRVLVMSSNGFASSTMKSALLFGSIVPVLLILRNCAPLLVAATITCVALIPAATMSAISKCGAYGVFPSVPTTMRTPAAFIFARLRAWISQNACASGRFVLPF